MSAHAVRLKVLAPVPFDCSFWAENDGWKGVCEELSLVAHGSSFESTKSNMEELLQEYVEAVLKERLASRANAKRVA